MVTITLDHLGSEVAYSSAFGVVSVTQITLCRVKRRHHEHTLTLPPCSRRCGWIEDKLHTRQDRSTLDEVRLFIFLKKE